MTTLPIYLPSGFQILVKVGDQVATDQVLAKREVVKDVVIDLARAFSTNPKNIKKYLKKNPGDRVSEGDVLVSRAKLLGMQEEKILSHVQGTVATYDRTSGRMSIILQSNEGNSDAEDIRSPIDGVIEGYDMESSDASAMGKILIKTDKNVLCGILGVGDTVEAEVYLLEEEKKHPEEVVVQLHHLDTNIIDKILIGGVYDRDVLTKAIGMGAKGIIGVTIREEDIEYLRERKLDAPVVTVSSKDFASVVKWNGKKIFLNGAGKTILFLSK